MSTNKKSSKITTAIILFIFFLPVLYFFTLTTGFHIKLKYKIVEEKEVNNYIRVKIKSYHNKMEADYVFLAADFYDENDVLIHTTMLQAGSFFFDKGFYEVSIPKYEKYSSYKVYLKHIKESKAWNLKIEDKNSDVFMYKSILMGEGSLITPIFYNKDGFRIAVDQSYYDDRHIEYSGHRSSGFRGFFRKY